MAAASSAITFPFDPLAQMTVTPEDRLRTITGILESYNGTYDTLIEAVQNAVDAVEDAHFTGLKAPYQVKVTVNLVENWISVLDTGIGMTAKQVERAFCPHVSFKTDPSLLSKRGAFRAYRGYKGVGLTFLAYATDDVRLHTKHNGALIKCRMEYGPRVGNWNTTAAFRTD